MSLALASSAFLDGYGTSIRVASQGSVLRTFLLGMDPRRRPFAFEGAAMGCRLLDDRDGGRRLEELRAGVDRKWAPLIQLGVGCALARLDAALPADPITLDGFGFQVGLRTGTAGAGNPLGSAYAERGRGRALWFVTGGRPEACGRVIDGSASAGALWRGAGTACAFAGDPFGAAGRLLGCAHGFEEDVREGVADAVRLWTALEGRAPARTLAVERAVG